MSNTSPYGGPPQPAPPPASPPGDPDRGGSSNTLYFIVGGLVVLVAVLAYLFLGGNGAEMADDPADDTNVTVEVPEVDSDTDTTE